MKFNLTVGLFHQQRVSKCMSLLLHVTVKNELMVRKGILNIWDLQLQDKCHYNTLISVYFQLNNNKSEHNVCIHILERL
jgi:hypothetical protein